MQHVCVSSQLVCMPAAAISASRWKSRRVRGVYAERGRGRKSRGGGGGRRVEVIDRERGVGMPQGGMKKAEEKKNKRVGKIEKAFNRCVFLPASSSLFCFITSALCSVADRRLCGPAGKRL